MDICPNNHCWYQRTDWRKMLKRKKRRKKRRRTTTKKKRMKGKRMMMLKKRKRRRRRTKKSQWRNLRRFLRGKHGDDFAYDDGGESGDDELCHYHMDVDGRDDDH